MQTWRLQISSCFPLWLSSKAVNELFLFKWGAVSISITIDQLTIFAIRYECEHSKQIYLTHRQDQSNGNEVLLISWISRTGASSLDS